MLEKIAFEWIFGLCFSGLLFMLFRINARSVMYLVFGVLPVFLILLLIPNLRVYGYHGLLQAGIVYQILEGHIPPFNPLFANVILLYPWGYHVLIAIVSKFANISPFYSSAALSVAALATILIILYKTSQIFVKNRIANIFSVVIPLYAFSFMRGTSENLFYAYFTKLFNTNIQEIRALPIVGKFNGCTAFHIGITFFVWYLYSLLKIFEKKELSVKMLIQIAISILGVGFFYPFMLPAVVLGCCATSVYFFIKRERIYWRPAVWILLIVAIESLLLMPYLNSITSLKHEAARLAISYDRPHFLRNMVILLITVTPIFTVIIFNRDYLLQVLREKILLMAILGIHVFFVLFLFLFITAPMDTEYKFLALGALMIGIIGGIGFANIYFKNKLFCFLVLTVFLIPFSFDMHKKIFTNWSKGPVDYYERGLYLYSRNPDADQFYRWIRNNTPEESIFIDSEMTIPIYSQRMLYIGFDKSNGIIPGYRMSPQAILEEVNGYDPMLIEKRRKVVEKLYFSDAKLNKKDLFQIISDLPRNSSVFIVARDSDSQVNLLNNPYCAQVFQNKYAVIFRLSLSINEN